MKTMIALAASACLFAAPVFAQETDTPAPQDDAFVMIDADADGALTLDEVQKVDEKVTEADFTKYDADKNETLSKMEFANWSADMKASTEASSGQ